MLNYSQPVSHFPNPIGPYTARHLAAPNLANTARIDQLMHDGKLYLSLDDAIALALENNLDIAIARYNLNIADTDVLRARPALRPLELIPASCRTRLAAASVASAARLAPEPAAPASARAAPAPARAVWSVPHSAWARSSPASIRSSPERCKRIISPKLRRSIFQGVFPGSRLAQNTGTGNFAYTQGFHWGTNLTVGFNNTRQTTDSFFSSVSPALNSSFRATITQPLLQGFGFAANTRFIRIAKNNRELSDVAFRLQVITTVNQIQSMYWDLVYAYENARVQKESLAFAEKTLSDTKKQVEIGSLAPIEVVRAQSTVAQDQQALTIALTNLQLEQLLMKNALSRTLRDQTLAGAEVIPTSTMEVPETERSSPRRI